MRSWRRRFPFGSHEQRHVPRRCRGRRGGAAISILPPVVANWQPHPDKTQIPNAKSPKVGTALPGKRRVPRARFQLELAGHRPSQSGIPRLHDKCGLWSHLCCSGGSAGIVRRLKQAGRRTVAGGSLVEKCLRYSWRLARLNVPQSPAHDFDQILDASWGEVDTVWRDAVKVLSPFRLLLRQRTDPFGPSFDDSDPALANLPSVLVFHRHQSRLDQVLPLPREVVLPDLRIKALGDAQTAFGVIPPGRDQLQPGFGMERDGLHEPTIWRSSAMTCSPGCPGPCRFRFQRFGGGFRPATPRRSRGRAGRRTCVGLAPGGKFDLTCPCVEQIRSAVLQPALGTS